MNTPSGRAPAAPGRGDLPTIASGSDLAAALEHGPFSGNDPTLQATAAPPCIPNVELSRELGRGGMGSVWLGRQTWLDRAVAVKSLDATHDQQFIARFRREARILAGLSHPNIVACYDAGTDANQRPYLVMELVDGPDLRRHVAAHGPLSPAAAVRVVREVAEGLAHAHAQGLIHRDVKPENVLLAPRDGTSRVTRIDAPDDAFPFTAKLADLGLARPMRQTGDHSLTVQGQLLGTPQTMAPEQFDDPDGVDHRADIYGLGCVLYFALTGEAAFSGHSFAELVSSKVHGRPPDPTRLRRDLPRGLGELTAAMLAGKREHRPADYADLLTRLQALGHAPAGRNRTPLLLAAVASIVVIGAAVAWFIVRSDPVKPAGSGPVQVRPDTPVRPSAIDPAPPVATTTTPTIAPAIPANPRSTLKPLTTTTPLHDPKGWQGDSLSSVHWSAPDDRERSIALSQGRITHPLPGLPCRISATLHLPKQFTTCQVGVVLTDGSMVALHLFDTGDIHSTLGTFDPGSAMPSTSVGGATLAARSLRIGFAITADSLIADLGGDGKDGKKDTNAQQALRSPPVALFLSLAGATARAVLDTPVAQPAP